MRTVKIAVLGAGAWGTALAISFTGKHTVSLWGRDKAQLEALAHERCNRRYLPTVTFPESLSIATHLDVAIAQASLILIATSTSGLAETMERAKSTAAPILWVCKGFDRARFVRNTWRTVI